MRSVRRSKSEVMRQQRTWMVMKAAMLLQTIPSPVTAIGKWKFRSLRMYLFSRIRPEETHCEEGGTQRTARCQQQQQEQWRKALAGTETLGGGEGGCCCWGGGGGGGGGGGCRDARTYHPQDRNERY